MCSPAGIATKVLFLGLLVLGLSPSQTGAVESSGQPPNPKHPLSISEHPGAVGTSDASTAKAAHPGRVNFQGEPKSDDVQHIADWVFDSGDNHSLPFAIIDKVNAKVFVFDAEGGLRGAAPVLLGMTRGDDSAPGIGNRKLSDVQPEERTTPAGRFMSLLGYDHKGQDILWVDYDSAVSLHRVVTTKPSERRLERLATPTPQDNRISYGCINVPAEFYNNVVSPAFTGTSGVVYVLPETRSIVEVFKSYYDVELPGGPPATANADKGTRPGVKKNP